MLGKVAVYNVMVIVSLSVLSVSSAPLSQLKHITLHLQPDILESHKIVITFEPLARDTKKTKNLPVEFEDSFDVVILNDGYSNEVEENIQQLMTIKEATDDEGRDNLSSESQETTDSPTNYSAAVDDAADAGVPTAPLNTRFAMPQTGMKSGIISHPSYDPDVHKFVVTFPNVQCPVGYRPDPSGKCRETFTLPGSHNMRMNNFLSSGEMKNKKMYKNKMPWR